MHLHIQFGWIGRLFCLQLHAYIYVCDAVLWCCIALLFIFLIQEIIFASYLAQYCIWIQHNIRKRKKKLWQTYIDASTICERTMYSDVLIEYDQDRHKKLKMKKHWQPKNKGNFANTQKNRCQSVREYQLFFHWIRDDLIGFHRYFNRL